MGVEYVAVGVLAVALAFMTGAYWCASTALNDAIKALQAINETYDVLTADLRREARAESGGGMHPDHAQRVSS